MRGKLLIVSGLLYELLCGACAQRGLAADSIWQQRDPAFAGYFVDSKARSVGDLLTVVITQDTSVANIEGRALRKSSSLSEGFQFAGESSGGFATQSSSADLSLSNAADREFQGNASFNSEREFTDRVTVSVVSIAPNGDLQIAGRRRTLVAGDETVLVISGIVRAIDIGPDNAVSSQFIANLNLSYESAGQERAFTRQGWLGRGMNRLWPF